MNIIPIANKNKCVSCGGCSFICPQNAIRMQYNKSEGLYKPVVDQTLCVNCGLCVKKCPSQDEISDKILGDHLRILLAQASDIEVRRMATSGGVINAILRYCFENKLIDIALVVKHDDNEIEAAAHIITGDSYFDLQSNAREYSSRYVSVPILAKLNEIELTGKRLAIVGTPCQVRAARKIFINSISNIFFIGVTCSSGMRYTATEEYKRICNAKDSHMYYRGNGWPGTNILISDNINIENNHSGSLFERMFSSQVFKNPACRECHDHFAEKADISLCDFWDTKELAEERIGHSCVIIRNSRAESIFSSAVKDNYISIYKELNDDEVINSQRQIINVKKELIKKKSTIKLFYKLIDVIFRLRIYKLFRYRIYNKLSTYYYKLSLLCKN